MSAETIICALWILAIGASVWALAHTPWWERRRARRAAPPKVQRTFTVTYFNGCEIEWGESDEAQRLAVLNAFLSKTAGRPERRA